MDETVRSNRREPRNSKTHAELVREGLRKAAEERKKKAEEDAAWRAYRREKNMHQRRRPDNEGG